MPILELELERQTRFADDVAWLRKTFLPTANARQASLFLLRILFNQVVGRQDEVDDAVFCVSRSPLTLPQIAEDLAYKHIAHVDAGDLLTQLLRRWAAHAAALRAHTPRRAFSVVMQNDELQVRERQHRAVAGQPGVAEAVLLRFPDVNSLGRAFPAERERLAALHIRYRYIGLDYQGAARDFAGLGYRADDVTVVEGFASALNHYFVRYCSAFPDLETAFGSIGSFWTLAAQPSFWMRTGEWLIANPPPNAAIAEHVLRAMPPDAGVRVSMTFPYWRDALALNRALETHSATASFVVHAPNTVVFINHLREKNSRGWNGNPVLEWTTKPPEKKQNTETAGATTTTASTAAAAPASDPSP
jgi:hypothetical protein